MTALTRIGAAGASALLAVGLFAAPPAGASDDHDPSPEDKARAARTTCLSSDGETQGRSMSDPDGTSNGGTDKPGCTAGIEADRDGNNGCGNDADREDDNNGHCGSKAQSSPSGADETGEAEEPSSATTTGDDSEPAADPSEVEDDADADDTDDADDADADDTDDADKDDEAGEDDAENDDAEKDDALTSDDGTSDSSTETPDEPETLPLNEAGAGFGLLALLGGIVRLFLRIG